MSRPARVRRSGLAWGPIAAATILMAACAGSAALQGRSTSRSDVELPTVEPPPAVSASVSASASAAPGGPQPYARAIANTLKEVTRVRRLPVKEGVKSFSLGRDALLEKTTKKMREEVPAGVIELQAEALRALGLIPLDYDLEKGFLKLITARVAGFYDPDEKAMYLMDDLTVGQEEETLPHELVHALQDQSFAIGPMLDFKAGQSDRLSAIQHLVEGDATMAGMEITYGSELEVDTDALRTAFLVSTTASTVGAETPPIIVSSLISPYTDGFAFAKALRAEGGWKSVDEAFRRLPASTEQTLHPEKYKADEKPLEVAAIPIAALGSDFKIGLDDQNGELGLRLMLEQFAAFRPAITAAEGWGGDRMVVAQTSGSPKRYAFALFTRMDTATDAHEVSNILRRRFGTKCIERKDLGPITWTKRGSDVVVVAGPYERGTTTKPAGDCKLADKWLNEILAVKQP